MGKNSVNQLIDQQCGFGQWKNYYNTVHRLRCSKDDQFNQLTPSEDQVYDTPIFTCKFFEPTAASSENWLAIANEDGKLAVLDTTNQQERYGIRAHNNAIFDLAWMFENMKIVTASGDHTARLFDVSNSDIREIRAFYGHSRSVKTITFRKNDRSVFATGARDGNIIIWDTRSDVGTFGGKADRTISHSHNVKVTPSKGGSSSSRRRCICSSPGASSAKSVTGLVFQDDNTLISCGAGDGVIKAWDLRKNYTNYKHEPVPKYRIPYAGSTTKNGFSSLLIDRSNTLLYANCLDSTIYCYNVQTFNPEPVMRYTGHQNSTFYIKSSLSGDGNYLISGSSDEKAYIWDTKSPHPIVCLKGHSAEVTCVAWSEQDNVTLVTCSDDMSHKIWRIGPEELPENWEIIGRGNAEILPLLEATPTRENRKHKRDFEDGEVDKKLVLQCDKCNGPTTSRFCSHCSTSSKKKRKLSPINPNAVVVKKPRCLFDDGASNIKEPLAQILEQDEATLERSKNDCSTYSAPNIIMDLPNFVVDGTAPHLHYSPPKKKMHDWLTRMRIERQFRRDMFGLPEDPPAKVPKLEASSPRRYESPQQPKALQSPILRYFKVKCDGHSCLNKTVGGDGGHVSCKTNSRSGQ